MKLFKNLKGYIATALLPGLLNWLAKSDTKLGKATKEVKDVVDKIRNDKDGVLDEKDIKELSTETIEAVTAILNLFGKGINIRIKRKNK